MSSPIQRSLVNRHFSRILEYPALSDQSHVQHLGFIWLGEGEERIANNEAIIQQISALNDMPMTLILPNLPYHLLTTHFNDFMDGLTTAEEAARRMHNTFSLWLME
jgi:hypothetical protein